MEISKRPFVIDDDSKIKAVTLEKLFQSYDANMKKIAGKFGAQISELSAGATNQQIIDKINEIVRWIRNEN